MIKIFYQTRNRRESSFRGQRVRIQTHRTIILKDEMLEAIISHQFKGCEGQNVHGTSPCSALLAGAVKQNREVTDPEIGKIKDTKLSFTVYKIAYKGNPKESTNVEK